MENTEEFERLEEMMKRVQNEIAKKQKKQKVKKKKNEPKIDMKRLTVMQYYFLRSHYPFIKYIFWVKIFPYIIMIIGFFITLLLVSWYVNITF